MRASSCLAGIAFLIFSCKKSDNNTINNPLPADVNIRFLSTNISDGLETVFFTSAGTGFVGGYKGGIYKTIDSGRTWTPLNSTVDLPIYSLFFLNDQKGFAVGGEDFCSGSGCTPPGSFILQTLNGGQTWKKVYNPTGNIELKSVYFVNASTGYCAGGNTIIKTSDGGQTWNEYKVNDLGGLLTQIVFTDPQKGYIASHSKIVETTDGGISWKVTSTQRNIGYVAISSADGVIYVAGQHKMIKSTNDGALWNELPNSPFDIYALHFIDNKKGFAFGSGNWSGGDFGHPYGAIYYTTDGGKVWSGSEDVKETGTILAASFPTGNLGYAVSGLNKIIRIKVN